MALAGLFVADDQLALATAHRVHQINTHDAGIEGPLHGATVHDGNVGRLHGQLHQLGEPLPHHQIPAEHVHHMSDGLGSKLHGEFLAGADCFVTYQNAPILPGQGHGDRVPANAIHIALSYLAHISVFDDDPVKICRVFHAADLQHIALHISDAAHLKDVLSRLYVVDLLANDLIYVAVHQLISLSLIL